MLRTLIVVVSIAMGGCLAIRDADDFEEDIFCDFTLPLRNFGIHASQSPQRSLRERFTISLIRERLLTNGETVRSREAVAVFDPLPGPNVDIRIPNAGIPALQEDQSPLHLEFFADRNGSDGFDQGDHSWFEPHACLASDVPFVHDVDFDDLEGGDAQQFTLVLQPIEEQIAIWQNSIEVRVRASVIIGESEEEVTRAFYRRANWDFARDSTESDLDQATIRLPGILRDSESVRITVFVDLNSDGEFQADTETAVESVFDILRCSGTCSRNADTFTQVVDLSSSSGVTELEPWWTLNDTP